ncbi:MAG: efflux RND transporter periplasmic adaptor subunit [Desulfuromonadales bacterium]|nr:efflux RND transporter periplasmic adaptor subunit [Desulfuromonadales bacterium]
MSKRSLFLKIILPLLIIAVGLAGFKMLIGMQAPPKKQAAPQKGLLVDVIRVTSAPHLVTVQATGTVQPSMEISLVPEVSGKVVWLSPKLVSGGFLSEGEKILVIDRRDYQLALNQAQAELARAEVSLQTEQQQARLALEEWQLLELADKGEPSPLVLREPQLRREQATLAAAQAGLEKARLNLERTVLYAPFNCRVRTEQVDPGQYLRAGNAIATLAGTDRVEINVPLPLSELQWLEIPRTGQSDSGAPAIITLQAEKQAFRWKGRIVRSLGEIDPRSHMATVVVAVDDPYRQSDTEGAQFDLAVGLFVEITLHGKQLPAIVTIPRRALRENNSLWIADQDDRLRIRPVNILRREQDLLLIDAGLAGGERLILTTLDGAADGLQLRPVEQE